MVVMKVKAVWNSKFMGIECLESNEEYGFFQNDYDVRPSSCIWINKEDAKKLYEIFLNPIKFIDLEDGRTES